LKHRTGNLLSGAISDFLSYGSASKLALIYTYHLTTEQVLCREISRSLARPCRSMTNETRTHSAQVMYQVI
jgi:hypothetical protein